MNEVITRVSLALRKNLAGRSMVLHDCYLHSVLGNDLLRRLGLETQIRIGYAAWRTGAGDFDVVACHPLAHDGDTLLTLRMLFATIVGYRLMQAS